MRKDAAASAAYACDPARTRGREFAPGGDTRGGLRTPFQRDRDRIVHSLAFRRLQGKTQVFVAPAGDHVRVRLTHSLEVAQIARTLARALAIDEDLTEAIALAHDIGHPPFGHAGEDALGRALAPYGGFDHNAHTLRVLMRLERPYCGHDGLNLSWETLEGLAKHNGPVARPGWALAELDAAWPLELGTWPSLEAQVAAIADDIAYDNHDVDDGLRAGMLDVDAVLAQPFIADTWRHVERAHAAAPRERQLRELVRARIGEMVDDVLEETRARAAGMASADDVRAAPRATAAFSPAMAAGERGFKRFMYERLYYHPAQVAASARASQVIAELFAAYAAQPARMGGHVAGALPPAQPDRARAIADHVAGMTDRFALARHAELAAD